MKQNKQKTTQPISMPKIEARIDRMLSGEGKIKAFASVTIGEAFAIHGIRVIDSEKGIFIAMPQEAYTKNGEKKYTNIFHAITSEARTALIEAVDTAYAHKMEEIEDQKQQKAPEEAPEEVPEEVPEQGMDMSM